MPAHRPSLHLRLHRLYHGRGTVPRRFRKALLVLDAVTVAFLAVTSFYHGEPWVEIADFFIGMLILAEFAARLIGTKDRMREILHPVGLADIIVIVSLLAPAVGENFAFLRVIRALRLLRSYRLAAELRADLPIVRRNEDTVFAAVHLFVFIFIMTALVYEFQMGRNPDIGNYADALYFTVTTLTTTGFGDITLTGQGGRLLAILIMVFGVSLFLRLLTTLFRPNKVHFTCPECGLNRHEADAIHCKHCGTVVNIPNEGLD